MVVVFFSRTTAAFMDESGEKALTYPLLSLAKNSDFIKLPTLWVNACSVLFGLALLFLVFRLVFLFA